MPRDVGRALNSVVLTHGRGIVKGIELCPPKFIVEVPNPSTSQGDLFGNRVIAGIIS